MNPALRKRRKERRRDRALRQMEAVLAVPCPTCGAKADVWCYVIPGGLGPGMHERRYQAADRD